MDEYRERMAVKEAMIALFEQYPTTEEYEIRSRRDILHWLDHSLSSKPGGWISHVRLGRSHAARTCGVPGAVIHAAVVMLTSGGYDEP